MTSKIFYDELWSIWAGKNGKRLNRELSRPYMKILHEYEKTVVELAAQFVSEGARVLDIGCGTGSIINKLAIGSSKKTKHVVFVGIDVSSVALGNALRESRRLSASCAFICASAEALPLRAGSFDILVLSEVIEHFKREKQLALLDCAFESAAFGGVLILTTPNRTKVWPNLIIPERVRKALTYVVTQKVPILAQVESRVYLKYDQVEHLDELSPNELDSILVRTKWTPRAKRGDVILPPLEHLFDKHESYQLVWGSLNQLVSRLPCNYLFTRGIVSISRKESLACLCASGLDR